MRTPHEGPGRSPGFLVEPGQPEDRHPRTHCPLERATERHGLSDERAMTTGITNRSRPRDYTYELYERLLETAIANDYEIVPVSESVAGESPTGRYAVIRHDVDRKPENALDLARMEADLGVSTTYYFRAIEKTFRPDLLTSVEDLGHEVGYHYEDVDEADGDLAAARRSFRSNLDRFRRYVDVETVAMHGNPLTPHDNRDLWEIVDPIDFDLSGEAYLSADFTDVVYFTDANRTWADEVTTVNDRPVGPASKPQQAESTYDLIELIDDHRLPHLYLSAHPNRWAETYLEWVLEFAKDSVVNIGKRGIWIVRSVRGSHPTPQSSDRHNDR